MDPIPSWQNRTPDHNATNSGDHVGSGSVLVNEAHDHVKNERFCRPIGGGIEFGEWSADAVVREIREELNAEVTNLQFVGTLEKYIHL